jgi:hypothetical protein
VLYLYAITHAPPALPTDRRGLSGAPLAAVIERELAAVVSSVESGDIDPTETTLWEHEAVCEALMETGTVLPARFGLLFSEEGALRDELRTRHIELRDALARVAGRVEVGVRILRQDGSDSRASEPSGAERPGTAYLTARVAEHRRARELAESVHEALAPLAAESRRQVVGGPALIMNAVYLLDRESASSFREKVERLAGEHTVAKFICTGPWPPYNFVTGSAESE